MRSEVSCNAIWFGFGIIKIMLCAAYSLFMIMFHFIHSPTLLCRVRLLNSDIIANFVSVFGAFWMCILWVQAKKFLQMRMMISINLILAMTADGTVNQLNLANLNFIRRKRPSFKLFKTCWNMWEQTTTATIIIIFMHQHPNIFSSLFYISEYNHSNSL